MATDETSSQSTDGGSPLRWFLVLPAAFLGLFIGELVFTFIAQLFWEHTVFSLFAVCCQLFFPPTTTIFPDHPVPLFDDRVGVALSSDIRLSKTRASLLPT